MSGLRQVCIIFCQANVRLVSGLRQVSTTCVSGLCRVLRQVHDRFVSDLGQVCVRSVLNLRQFYIRFESGSVRIMPC